MNTLSRVQACLEQAVANHECAGISVLVRKAGQDVLYAAAGHADIATGKKVQRDYIFRLYSQSKPITAAAALLLEWETGLTVLEGTWEELVDQGYIDGENLYWEDGYFLSATETQRTDTGLTFSAQLWRSGLGALFYSDCNVGREVNGPWEEYIIGAVAVS